VTLQNAQSIVSTNLLILFFEFPLYSMHASLMLRSLTSGSIWGGVIHRRQCEYTLQLGAFLSRFHESKMLYYPRIQ
jgi:hypothetical protein